MNHNFWVALIIGFAFGIMVGAIIMYGGRKK